MLPFAALDLTRYHARYVHGDLMVVMTWLDRRDHGGTIRPCLVIVPTHGTPRARKVAPCVVTIDRAWIWAKQPGNEQAAGETAAEFVMCLGLPETPRSADRIHDLILDHLEDLIRMPPMPSDMRQKTVLGEGRITERDSGRIVQEGEIVLH